jgi:NADH:ubiquinone oxidoreductase subunit E
MTDKILVCVCTECAACADCDEDLKAELRALRQAHAPRVVIAEVDCLDECDFPPAMSVNGVSISPATPEKLRAAVEKLLKNGAKPAH